MRALKARLDKLQSYSADSIRRAFFEYAKDVFKDQDHDLKDIGIERSETKEFYHRYNIDEAKELEPLKKSYLANYVKIDQLEGRDLTPETRLKEGDFWKMFFAPMFNFSETNRAVKEMSENYSFLTR